MAECFGLPKSFRLFFALAAERMVAMLTRNRLCVVLSVAALLTLSATCVQAASVTVVNPSFEDPILADDGTGNPAGWTLVGSAAIAQAWNPPVGSYSGADLSGTPTGADGANVVELMFNSAGGVAGFTQTTSAILTAGTTYTLTLALGNRGDAGWQDGRTWNSKIALATADMAAGTYLDSLTFAAADLPWGSFTDKTLTFTVDAGNAHIGQAVTIVFGLEAPAGKYSASCFDNVRLSAVPEPATLSLLASGLIGLLCYAWRKRK